MAKNMIPTHASYLADVARAAHQTGKDLTLEEVAAVIEAVNSLAAPGVSTVEDAPAALNRDRIEEIAREVYKVERFTKDDEVWHNLHWLTTFAKAIEKELRPAPAAGDALPSKPGVYAWSAGTSNALVLVDRRPSAHSPAGVLNGHVIESTRFYDGCAVESWGRDGRWTLLHDFDAAIAAQRNGGQ